MSLSLSVWRSMTIKHRKMILKINYGQKTSLSSEVIFLWVLMIEAIYSNRALLLKKQAIKKCQRSERRRYDWGGQAELRLRGRNSKWKRVTETFPEEKISRNGYLVNWEVLNSATPSYACGTQANTEHITLVAKFGEYCAYEWRHDGEVDREGREN